MAIKNVMEMIVQDVLNRNLSQLKLRCTCERCLDDIQAHALNNLPPKYIVNPEHQPYIRAVHEVNQNEALNILKVVTQAVTIISASPRCENVTS